MTREEEIKHLNDSLEHLKTAFIEKGKPNVKIISFANKYQDGTVRVEVENGYSIQISTREFNVDFQEFCVTKCTPDLQIDFCEDMDFKSTVEYVTENLYL